MHPISSMIIIGALALVCSRAAPAQSVADTILSNGKSVTVDDRFSIVEALAIKGERILAVGSNAEIEKHKGPDTRVVDLNRRTVIPGLIDNHAHYMRAAEYWHREVRLDGITSHAEAPGFFVLSRARGDRMRILCCMQESGIGHKPELVPRIRL